MLTRLQYRSLHRLTTREMRSMASAAISIGTCPICISRPRALSPTGLSTASLAWFGVCRGQLRGLCDGRGCWALLSLGLPTGRQGRECLHSNGKGHAIAVVWAARAPAAI
jgi:hypothetical protein